MCPYCHSLLEALSIPLKNEAIEIRLTDNLTLISERLV